MPRVTAAVLSRSSCKRMGKAARAGGPWLAMLAANWRTDWQRGPSLPSMLSGRPIASALMSCFFASSASAARSAASLPRFKVVSGVASMRSASDVATPIVLAPTSSAINRPLGANAFKAVNSTIATRDLAPLCGRRGGGEPGDDIAGDPFPARLTEHPMALAGIFDVVRDRREALGGAADDSRRCQSILLGGDEQQRCADQPRVDGRGLAAIEPRQRHLEQRAARIVDEAGMPFPAFPGIAGVESVRQ